MMRIDISVRIIFTVLLFEPIAWICIISILLEFLDFVKTRNVCGILSVGSAFGRRSLDIADNYKKELYRVSDTALFTVGDRLYRLSVACRSGCRICVEFFCRMKYVLSGFF